MKSVADEWITCTIFRRIAIVVLMLLLSAGATFAQAGFFGVMPLTQGRTFWNPIVGSGAVYRIDVEGDALSNGTMEVDVLGKERVNGKDAFWVQVVGKTFGKPEWVWKRLVDGASPHQIFKSVFQLSGHPPIALTVPGQATQAHQAENESYIGREVITVLAGTFECDHYRSRNSPTDDVWLSKKVVVWGVVKEQGTHNGKVVHMMLVRTLTHPKDRIPASPLNRIF
ncbi:MAG TPA: hypothetical protein VKB26_06055 [Candidatus Acidoferrales bacterium]|nr:hypothetical protein [Candidatus Acidoferrales bacterium]